MLRIKLPSRQVHVYRAFIVVHCKVIMGVLKISISFSFHLSENRNVRSGGCATCII